MEKRNSSGVVKRYSKMKKPKTINEIKNEEYWKGYKDGKNSALKHNIILLKSQLEEGEQKQ